MVDISRGVGKLGDNACNAMCDTSAFVRVSTDEVISQVSQEVAFYFVFLSRFSMYLFLTVPDIPLEGNRHRFEHVHLDTS